MKKAFTTLSVEEIIRGFADAVNRHNEDIIILEAEDNFVRSCIAMTLSYSNQYYPLKELAGAVNVSGSRNPSEVSTLIRNDEKIAGDFRENYPEQYNQFVTTYRERQEERNRERVGREEEVSQLRRDLEIARRELEEIQRLNSEIMRLSIRVGGSVQAGLQRNPGNQQGPEPAQGQAQVQGNQQAAEQANEQAQGQGNQQAAEQANEQAQGQGQGNQQALGQANGHQGQGGQEDFEEFF